MRYLALCALLVAGCDTKPIADKPAAPATTPLQSAQKQLTAGTPTQKVEAANWLAKAGKKATAAVGDLVKAAQDPNLQVKLAALNALAQIGRAQVSIKAAGQTLVAALGDSSADVRAAAAEALAWAEGAGQSELVARLGDGADAVRKAAADALGRLKVTDTASVDAVIARLHDGSATVRAAAARALGRIGPPARRAVATLAERTRDAHAAVRIWARQAVTALDPGHVESLKPVIDLLSNPKLQGAIRAQAEEVLRVWTTGKETELAPALKEVLVESVPGREDELRWLALQITRVVGGDLKPIVPDLIEAARDEAHPIRLAAIEAIGALGEHASAAGETVKGALGDADETIRAAAARTYGAVASGAESAKLLANKLLDKSAPVRAAALDGLHRLGDAAKAALPDARAALKDASEAVRAAAARTVATLSDTEKAKALLDDLLPLLKDASSDVRAAAARAYGKTASMTADAAEAAKVLAAAVGDDVEAVTLAALDGLKALGGKAKDAMPAILAAMERGGDAVKKLAQEAIEAAKDAVADE